MAYTIAAGFQPNDPRMARLDPIIQRYEISQSVVRRLRTLENCEVVILVDDSGSMNMPLQGTNETRWDEMRKVNLNSSFSFNHYLFLIILSWLQLSRNWV